MRNETEIAEVRTVSQSIVFHLKHFFLLILLYIFSQLPNSIVTGIAAIGKMYKLSHIAISTVAIVLLLLFVAVSYFIARKMGVVYSKRNLNRKNIVWLIGGYICLQVTSYFFIFLQHGQEVVRENLYFDMVQSGLRIPLFLSFALVGPIIEEIIFRGFILNSWLKDKPKVGFVVSVVIFTLVHVPNNVFVLFQYLLISAIFAYVYQKKGSLEITTGMHILNNLPAGIQLLLM